MVPTSRMSARMILGLALLFAQPIAARATVDGGSTPEDPSTEATPAPPLSTPVGENDDPPEPAPPLAPPALLAAESVRDFADHLLEQGDAYRAIGEYKRYLFLAPEAHDLDLISYRIALSYAVGGQNENALAHFERIERDAAARPEIRHAAWAAAGRAFFDLGQHGTATIHLDHPPPTLSDPELIGWAAYTRGHGHLLRFDLARAAEAFDEVPPATAWSDPAAALAAELTDPPRLSSRSPTLAGFLSLVPGLGHVYLGMWGTAVSALTWNGAFIWAMYEAGSAGYWGIFTLLAVVESLWYTGTIYGAVAGAFRHNRDARLNYLDELESMYPKPSPPPQPAVGDARPLDLDPTGY